MPLTELMNYFNDQLHTQARLHQFPRTGFFKVDNHYWARFGNLILASHFSPLIALSTQESVGHYAELFVRSSTGKQLNITDIVNNLEDTEQVIFLDRLVRTLHSLNYLQRFDGETGYLALPVQPRHIASVAEGHGKAFEKILSDCGLGANRVILHTQLPSEDNTLHFRQAFESYRRHGYQLAICVTTVDDVERLSTVALDMDFIITKNLGVTTPLLTTGNLHHVCVLTTSSEHVSLLIETPVSTVTTTSSSFLQKNVIDPLLSTAVERPRVSAT